MPVWRRRSAFAAQPRLITTLGAANFAGPRDGVRLTTQSSPSEGADIGAKPVRRSSDTSVRQRSMIYRAAADVGQSIRRSVDIDSPAPALKLTKPHALHSAGCRAGRGPRRRSDWPGQMTMRGNCRCRRSVNRFTGPEQRPDAVDGARRVRAATGCDAARRLTVYDERAPAGEGWFLRSGRRAITCLTDVHDKAKESCRS